MNNIFQLDTLVTDILSAAGFLMIIFSPLYFLSLNRKVLNQRLHTKIDGEKLFEKLKYDLRIPRVTGIDKKRLYRDIHYARTIFRGAMEYNHRDMVWYFNELYAKIYIHSVISKRAWMVFWIWILTILVIVGGSREDILYFLFNQKGLTKVSGHVSIWVMFLMNFVIFGLNKYYEWIKVKRAINDEVRQINLAKKEKVWKDYKIIYFASIAPVVVGFMFILINIAF
ncbi:hypothetical protein SHELI_v1c06710 [Spiroplasma helicoides]|uniref:Uncharacterized protein n=1 Tax=Spiroplasma helicoides TaxID=216938 RepID=A0A1B3SL09_9MOLU|nr:hypothetical protein [Spiroplasma helicoides]AOG60622.1 hypothetical protein SHELI_v1c06710 [Spiroplasma helicoides]